MNQGGGRWAAEGQLGRVALFHDDRYWSIDGVFGSLAEASASVRRWGLSGWVVELQMDVLPYDFACGRGLVDGATPVSAEELRALLQEPWGRHHAENGVLFGESDLSVAPADEGSSKSTETVWVFQGADLGWTAAVFSTEVLARRRIAEAQLSGVLTSYPLGLLPYEWAVRRGSFREPRRQAVDGSFIGTYVSIDQRHEHFCDGVPQELMPHGDGAIDKLLPASLDLIFHKEMGAGLGGGFIRITDYSGMMGRICYQPAFGGSGEAYLGRVPSREWFDEEAKEQDKAAEVRGLTDWFRAAGSLSAEIPRVLDEILVDGNSRRWGAPISAQVKRLLMVAGMPISSFATAVTDFAALAGRYPLGSDESVYLGVRSCSRLLQASASLPQAWAPYVLLAVTEDEGGAGQDGRVRRTEFSELCEATFSEGEYFVASELLSPWLSAWAGGCLSIPQMFLDRMIRMSLYDPGDGDLGYDVSLSVAGPVGDVRTGDVYEHNEVRVIYRSLIEDLGGVWATDM
ncbi:MAG: hypothetical protein QM708_07575 [Propioniciclava sp.]|uniref:DUF7710 domain-containing protein n=1 Tax=Propioniciclava sp. TaxID=2038686 RepID=UPI0039E30CB3